MFLGFPKAFSRKECFAMCLTLEQPKVNPCRAGGGLLGHSTSGFSTCLYFFHMLKWNLSHAEMKFSHAVKISNRGHSRSGHKVISSGLTSAVPVSVKFLSRIFYIGDLRSGQFCDLFIMSLRENERRLFLTKTIPWNIWLQEDLTLSRNIATRPSSCRQGHFRW